MSPDRIELTEQVHSLSAIQAPKDSKGRIRWNILKEDLSKLTSYIEQEATRFLQQRGTLTQTALGRNNLSWLAGAIYIHYPGGIRQLKTNLGLEPSSKPKGYWTPEQILIEARGFYQNENSITHRLLKSKQRANLSSQITRVYPGGMPQLKLDLGLRLIQIPRKQQTAEELEQEAREIFQQAGAITQKVLRELGKSSLSHAVSEYYPGGWVRLKEKLAVPIPNKPAGYWTPERIEEETKVYTELFGDISQDALTKNGFGYLIGAIRHYPGGVRELRRQLELKVPYKQNGYWTPENIEEEATEFLKKHGGLSNELLRQHGLSSLGAAIAKLYPLKMRGLRAKLGVPYEHKPNDYWKNPDHIESEALKAIEDGIPLNQRRLHEAGQSSLTRAITRYYPGGMQALKEKLGIVDSQTSISAEEANEQLRRLLEESL